MFETTLTAIELTGIIDEHQHLHLDSELPIRGPKRVRVIVLHSLEDEWTEQEWLHSATTNSAFDFLNDPAEDIYSLSDGKPLTHET